MVESFSMGVFFSADLVNGYLSLCNQVTLSSSLASSALTLLSPVCNACGHMVDDSEIIFGIYIGILLPLMYIK